MSENARADSRQTLEDPHACISEDTHLQTRLGTLPDSGRDPATLLFQDECTTTTPVVKLEINGELIFFYLEND